MKSYDQECSLRIGHIDLDMGSIRSSKMTFGKQISSFAANCGKNDEDENHFQPVVTVPLTGSKFKLVNIRCYLSLSAFCGCCKKRLRHLATLNSINMESVKLSSTIAFNSEFSPFNPFVRSDKLDNDTSKVTNNEDCSTCDSVSLSKAFQYDDLSSQKKVDDTQMEMLDLIISPDTTDKDNNLKKSPVIVPHVEPCSDYAIGPSPEKESVSTNRLCSTGKKGAKSNSSYVSTKQILDDIYKKYYERINNTKTNYKMPLNSVRRVVERNEVTEYTPNVLNMSKNVGPSCEVSKTINVNSDDSKLVDEFIPIVVLDDIDELDKDELKNEPGKAELKTLTREPVLNDTRLKSSRTHAKVLKKEKRKQKKRLEKKVSADLSPPLGVDLEEFLHNQVASIKWQLKNISDLDSPVKVNRAREDRLSVPDLIKDHLKVDGKELLGSLGKALHSSEETLGYLVASALHRSKCDQVHRKVNRVITGRPESSSGKIFETKLPEQYRIRLEPPSKINQSIKNRGNGQFDQNTKIKSHRKKSVDVLRSKRRITVATNKTEPRTHLKKHDVNKITSSHYNSSNSRSFDLRLRGRSQTPISGKNQSLDQKKNTANASIPQKDFPCGVESDNSILDCKKNISPNKMVNFLNSPIPISDDELSSIKFISDYRSVDTVKTLMSGQVESPGGSKSLSKSPRCRKYLSKRKRSISRSLSPKGKRRRSRTPPASYRRRSYSRSPPREKVPRRGTYPRKQLRPSSRLRSRSRSTSPMKKSSSFSRKRRSRSIPLKKLHRGSSSHDKDDFLQTERAYSKSLSNHSKPPSYREKHYSRQLLKKSPRRSPHQKYKYQRNYRYSSSPSPGGR